MKFNFLHRGYGEWILLLPGWAFIPEIFSRLDLKYNYIFPAEPLTGDITDAVSNMAESRGISRISLFGWSLGATSASILALKRPDITGRIWLVSVMRHFPAQEAERVMKDIRRDRVKALNNFHRLCFTGQKRDYEWFIKNLQEKTICMWDTASLEAGLKFLVRNPFDTAVIENRDTACFHGSRDIVSPLQQSPCAGTSCMHVIRGAGHLPFLAENFSLLHDSSGK